MKRFHPLTIVAKEKETDDSVVLTLQASPELQAEYAYAQGQHLPLRMEIDGKSVRRTYSICSSVADSTLRLGIRVQTDGLFSNYVAEHLNVGDTIDAMPPYGHFNTPLNADKPKNYAAFVAGSGITPLLSIVKTTLETEPGSRFVVFYGNRQRSTTMFIEDLYALKNIHRDRLALHFIMSQEPTELALYEGRLDGAKVSALHDAFLKELAIDEVFICGPNPMIDNVTAALTEAGYAADNVHSERFRPGLKTQVDKPKRTVASDNQDLLATIDVIVDGQRQRFAMHNNDESVLDAALRNGIDLPYSCKGGVCSTCRCKQTAGASEMTLNYALEPWELEAGFILTCQARPTSDTLELDYDQT
ncbi:MAG: 2Fe-2S iron-sulfur cluster-binding protein [Pseudomonadota bacterium]